MMAAGIHIVPLNSIDRITYAMTGRKHKVPISVVIHCAKDNRLKADIDRKPEYHHEVVERRNTFGLNVKPDPVEQRHVKIKRRDLNMGKGLFSPFGEPYKQLGEVELDTKKLTLDILLPGWKPIRPPQIKRDYLKKTREKPIANDDFMERTIRTLSGSDVTTGSLIAGVRQDRGGMKAIQDAVQESNNYVQEVQKGRNYEDIVKDIIRMSRQDKPITRATRMRNLSDHEVSDWDSDTIIISHKYDSPDDTTVDNMIFLSKVESAVEKLDRMYVLLCSMFNLRVRDLKSRIPLSHDYVLSLRYWPSQLDPGYMGTFGTSSRHSMPRNSMAAGSQMSRMSFGQRGSKMGMHGRTVMKKGKLFMGVKGKHTPRDQDVVILETWEDLLFHDTSKAPGGVRSRPPEEEYSPKRRMSWRRTSRVTPRQIGAVGGASNTQVHGQKRTPLPPWQSVANNEKAIIALKVDAAKEVEDSRNLCGFERIQTQRCEFFKLQHEIGKKVKKQVEDLKTVRYVGFYQKFSVLSHLDPISVPVISRRLSLMSGITDQLLMLAANAERKQAMWYKNLTAKYPPEIRGDMRVQAALAKLERFSTHSIIESLPHAKECVCLLAFSYPGTEMINRATQEAFTCVLVDILESRPELFVQWMNSRCIGMTFDWNKKYASVINSWARAAS